VARDVVRRAFLRGWVTAISPLAVGGLGDLPGIDALVAADGQGRPVLRGSSLAGALSARLDRPSVADPVDLWGSVPERGSREPSRASRLTVEDAVLLRPPTGVLPAHPGDEDSDESFCDPAVWLVSRDGVGIDRFTGVAAPGVLYARQLVPAGAVAPLRLMLESTRVSLDADDRFLDQLTALLDQGVAVGARTARGLGLIRWHGRPHRHDRPYDSPSDYLASLTRPRWVPVARTPSKRDRSVGITVTWYPDDSVFVGSGLASDLADALPLVEPDPASMTDNLRLVIPGTSIAGALRQRAEYIVTTLADDRTARPSADPAAFAATIARSELVGALFGNIGADDGTGGLGALTVHDCRDTAAKPIPRSDWRWITQPLDLNRERQPLTRPGAPDAKVTAAREVEAKKRADAVVPLGFRLVQRVAIDRWTGGAADGRLFSRIEPDDRSWGPIELDLALARIPEELQKPCLVLLWLILRDLAEGLIPLGGGTTQGLGDVCVETMTSTDPDAFDPVKQPPDDWRDAWTSRWSGQDAQ
jgi:CRISPR/Cas system CSM-associated protein Csm3 (group 7 of RAMP superfamily)